MSHVGKPLNTKLAITLLGVVVAFAFGFASTSEAGPRKRSRKLPRPAWAAGAAKIHSQRNQSYLSELEGTPQFGIQLNQTLFEPGSARNMRLRYEQLSREYELRQNQGVLDSPARIEGGNARSWGSSLEQGLSDLRNEAVGHVRTRQRDRGVEVMDEVTDRATVLRTVKEPVAAVAALAGLTLGKPIRFRLGESARIEARANAVQTTGDLYLQTALFNGSFEYAGDGSGRDGGALGTAFNFSEVPQDLRAARFRLNVNRGIPMLDMQSRLTYVGATTTWSATLSKPIYPNLTAVLDHSQAIDPARSGIRGGVEETFKLLYGVQF